jgi:hypothetical protein
MGQKLWKCVRFPNKSVKVIKQAFMNTSKFF